MRLLSSARDGHAGNLPYDDLEPRRTLLGTAIRALTGAVWRAPLSRPRRRLVDARSIVVIGKLIFREKDDSRTSHSKKVADLERRLLLEDIQLFSPPISVPEPRT